MFIFSKTLSFEASFLEMFSLILAYSKIKSIEDGWLGLKELYFILVTWVTLVVWPLLLAPSLSLLLWTRIIDDEIHVLLCFRAVILWVPNVSTDVTYVLWIISVMDGLSICLHQNLEESQGLKNSQDHVIKESIAWRSVSADSNAALELAFFT